MKKVFSLFGLLYTCLSFSQVITINDTRTADDLVRNVLVNSPCANVANVTSRTGTFYGSSNGIGYFTNTNTNFPLSSGVILSTGNVLNSPGPNSSDLSDGSVVWAGDTALENALAAAGVSMNSINATVVEFDFTSFTTYFNFQFLFASEEYGTYQCQSPDAFAFLLTDSVTGITTNLAVIPSTTIPISVGTIRDALYNSSCPSANASYFGRFNGGSNAAASPINFNGQTVLMNASSNLIANRTYHIKLVVADNANNNNDVRFDSAIFLGGSSFVFNQDVLGPDLTIANNTALCVNDGVNEPYTITSGLNPAQFTFVWKDGSGVPIPGETGPNLTVTSPGTYQLTYYIAATNCEVATNDIVIEYNSPINTPNPSNMYKCNNGQPSYAFDLSYNTLLVDPSSSFTISYHNTQLEAQTNSNPLGTNINVLTPLLPKTVWMRIVDNNGCYVTRSFNLDLTPPPSATDPGDITQCESSSGSNTAAFNLAGLSGIIMGGQSTSIYNLSYHLSQADADNDTNPIDISSPLITANTTIYIRIENTSEPTCFNTTQSFNLIVKPRPAIDLIPNQFVCVEYILPALANGGNYYSGPNQGLPLLPVGTAINTNSTIYIYNETGGTPSCFTQHSFDVTIVDINDITPSIAPSCDISNLIAYPLPGTKYFLDAAFTQEVFPGHPITATGTTTIYVQFTFTDPSCTPIASQFNIVINKTPTISNTFSNVFDCNAITSLPTIITDIGTAGYYTYDTATNIYTPLTFPITTTTHVYAFAENNSCRSTIYNFMAYINTLGIPNVDVCTPPYTLNPSPFGEYRSAPNGGGNVIPPGDINTNTRVYTYIAGAACANDDFFDITFHQPTLTIPVLAPQCDSYSLPINAEGGRYFTQAGGPSNSTNVEYFPGRVITATETIYIYKESTTAPPSLTPTCYNEVSWTITINPKPVIDSRGAQVVCYSYQLTSLVNGNYYEDPNGVNPITDFTIDASDLRPGTEQSTRIKTIYIYAANPNDSSCFSQNPFTVTLDGIQALNPNDVHSCDNYTLPALPANMFYYDTANNDADPTTPHPGAIIPAGTVINATQSVFIYTYSFNRFACEDENEVVINIYPTPIITPAVPSAINACNSYDLTQVLTTGKYYTLSGGPTTPGNTEIIPPFTFTSSQTIYAFDESGNATITPPLRCTVEQPIVITIFNVTELPDVPATCTSYTLNPSDLKPGENYYDSLGNLLAPNAVISTPGVNTIFIRANAPFVPTCMDESDFTITIVPTPIANPTVIAPVCDTYTANNGTNFDGIYQFDLTQVQATVLGSQTPASDFIITYHSNSGDASSGNNPITNPTTYQNPIPFFDSVWVRVTNRTTSNPCFAYTEVKLVINPLPEPHLGNEYFICEDYETGTILNTATIDTGISGSNYLFEWTLNGQPYGGNTSSITTNQEGNYDVTITNTSTNCKNTATTKVTKYAPYISISYSDAFIIPSYITINVLGNGSGNYEYQLDNGLFQTSNTFYNVSPGEHEVHVRDLNGYCSPKPLIATVINYPKFFTPNGDGYHETWNIKDLESTNPNAPIFIFDRFGKLIKKITPSTSGWDGNYNNQPLPATDYWFTVEYDEKGVQKVFKAHFSLKR